MTAFASSVNGWNGLPSTLNFPAEISVTLMPSCSSALDISLCAMNTPMEPATPLGSETISSACAASQ